MIDYIVKLIISFLDIIAIVYIIIMSVGVGVFIKKSLIIGVAFFFGYIHKRSSPVSKPFFNDDSFIANKITDCFGKIMFSSVFVEIEEFGILFNSCTYAKIKDVLVIENRFFYWCVVYKPFIDGNTCNKIRFVLVQWKIFKFIVSFLLYFAVCINSKIIIALILQFSPKVGLYLQYKFFRSLYHPF